jgi:hypothetical protein
MAEGPLDTIHKLAEEIGTYMGKDAVEPASRIDDWES